MTDAFKPRSDFLRVLIERGYVHQCSDFAGLDAKALSGSLVAYIGFDCTAPSLHVGSLVQIMMLRWLQQTGGKPIALMGGGTTHGRRSLRQGREPQAADRRADRGQQGRHPQGLRPLHRASATARRDAVMPDNAEWLAKLNYIDFLRDVGRHFSVNRMLAMDSVKLRLEREQELSFLEFNYMCLQAYDFVELNRRYGCTLQMGGSDQWGNIVTGIDLGRRWGPPQLYALTSPLITTASGAKMGKTAAGAVWLDAAMLAALRLLAVLAQHRGRRRRPLPQAVHPAAARRDRAARGARRRRDQRGQEDRSPTRRPRCCTGARRPKRPPRRRAQTFEEGALAEIAADRRRPGGGIRRGPWRAHRLRARRPRRLDRRGAPPDPRRRRCGSTTSRSPTRRAAIGRDALHASGVVKLSLGRKKHVLLRAV